MRTKLLVMFWIFITVSAVRDLGPEVRRITHPETAVRVVVQEQDVDPGRKHVTVKFICTVDGMWCETRSGR